MALENSFEIEEADGCKSWELIDTTGDYNDPNNLTGFGAPNIAASTITSATISILFYGSTVPYIFTFTIVTGTITACTVTNPAGVVTNILADLSATAFPFSVAEPFVILPEWIGLAEGDSMPIGAIYTEYNISDGTDNYTADCDQLIVCSVCCCVTNMKADLDSRSCDCQESNMDKAIKATIWLDAANYAMEQEDVDKAHANLLFAKSICEGSCTGC